MKSLLSRRGLGTAVALAIIALVLVVPAFVLAGAPVLVLALALITGWFPGERAIERLRGRRTQRRVFVDTRLEVGANARTTPRCSRLLICFALANRPPPAPLHA